MALISSCLVKYTGIRYHKTASSEVKVIMTKGNGEKELSRSSGEGTKGGAGSGAGDGIRSIRSTSLFRAVNFELYAKPNKFVMGVGLIALTGCVVYIAYLNAQKENQRDRDMYEQYRADGTTMMRPRTSKWD